MFDFDTHDGVILFYLIIVFAYQIYVLNANLIILMVIITTLSNHNAVQYNTIQYNTIQNNTKFNTIQYNTKQYKIQYNTIQYKIQLF
jgi:hypothetical protein